MSPVSARTAVISESVSACGRRRTASSTAIRCWVTRSPASRSDCSCAGEVTLRTQPHFLEWFKTSGQVNALSTDLWTSLDAFEHMFETRWMTPTSALDPARPVLDQLRERVTAMEGGPARLPVPVLPALSGLVSLRTGGSYGVDSASLALALVAGASRAGEWVGFAGWP